MKLSLYSVNKYELFKGNKIMIYTPRYIFNSDLEELICTCDNSKKYRVLYSHSSSIENAKNSELIGLSSQIIAICSNSN